MYQIMKVVVVGVVSFLGLVLAQSDDPLILESPNRTNFGSWGVFENCSAGEFVTAFQVKVEPKNSLVDDTGLNAIRFFCGDAPVSITDYEADPTDNRNGSLPLWENITSSIGYFGYWGKIFDCKTYGVGFDLEVQSPQGKYKDDAGATNLRLLCGEGRNLEGYFNNGHGHAFKNASYTGSQRCPVGHAVCGLQTQVEVYQALGDDTSLNNIRVKCCPILMSG